MYLLEPSLAAALLDELFEHPAGGSHYSASGEDHRGSSVATLFFRSLQVICVREELFVKARANVELVEQPMHQRSDSRVSLLIQDTGREAPLSARREKRFDRFCNVSEKCSGQVLRDMVALFGFPSRV